MKLKSVWLWLTSMLLYLKYFHGARPNDCMPRSTFMSRGDSNGWRLIGFVFHYFEKISLGDCAEECLRRTNCKSLNYNAITMYCELNKESYTTMPANINSDSEFYHSLRSTWETGNLLLGFTLPTCAVNERVSEKDQKTCILAECKDPPERQFAQHTSTLREVGSVVYYSCLPQYGSLGNVISTCKPDGSWSNNSFECWRNCTHPPVVNHGTTKPLWALKTQFLSYVCDANYEAVGDPRVFCQYNGSWTEMNFVCLRICENPPLIPNSSPNVSRTLDGRAVSYTCHVDYVGFGNTDVFCQPDGTWSNSTYVCVRECKNPPIVPNSTPSATKVLHGNLTVYSCNVKYVSWPLGTSTEARCESDGRWTFLANFLCKIECTDPPSLAFGTTNQSSALEGSSVIYVCDTGFDSVAAINSLCNADGNWTTPSGPCLGVCRNPPLVPNSSPNASRTLDGSAVSYTCYANFVGIGINEVSCKPDGTWSKSIYVCKRKCTNPPSLTFGTANNSYALEGMSVTYMCRTGYNSTAAITSTCKADGSWTVPSSPCIRECTNPPSLTFGTANNNYALKGMIVTYTCQTGYNSTAAITSTCNADGSWTVPSLPCVRECTNPPLVTNGTANTSYGLEGSSVAYVCDDGYDSVGAIMSTCTASGKWTTPSSSCIRECTNSPSVTNGTANTSSALEGSSVAYVCDDGYDSDAAIMSTCTESGDWTPPSSSCLIECTNPPLVTNGTANTSSALEGSSVAYVCDDGYDSDATIMSTCTASGDWTPPSPSCLRECTNPPSPFGNATPKATSALAGQAIVYMCNDGLSSVNVTELMCLEDGSWSEANFLCE
ncbi:hypothetical protein ACJMK2_029429 [Sinanodonta woodiana]|uniref:Sushi/von Willebrand factor type A/EGF/pentraxin domain-containing 1 n=1 Tax=Sinanodonta woodiana TaxID=1069815 RepID=A0ABD3XC38_SINWO